MGFLDIPPSAASDSAVAAAINGTGTATRGALNATYAQQWKPATAYTAGQPVVNPTGDVVTAKAAFTSGATYTETSWAPSPTFDKGHVTDLRKWYGALANVYSAQANILVVGDSNSEGTGSGDYSLRWQQILQDVLRKSYQPPGVTGATYPYVSASPRTVPALTGYPVSATGGAQASYGLGVRAWDFARDGIQSMTFTFTGGRFEILHTKGPSTGRLNIVIDGGAPIIVDTYKANPITSGNVWDSGTITNQAHTVVITRSNGTTEPLFVEGFLAFNGDQNAGIRVIDGARHGATLSTFTGSTAWQSAVTAAGPYGLCIMPWGANDSTIPTAAADFRTQLDSLINQLRTVAGFAGSILLVEMPKRGNATEQVWTDYRTQIEALAAGDPDIVTLDLRRRMPDNGTAEAVAADLYYDEVHYKPKGQGWIAQQIFAAIRPR